MLVEGDEQPQDPWCEDLGEQHVGRTIAFHDAMRNDVFWCSFGAHLVGRLAEGQCLGLGEDVRREDVVMRTEWIEALGEADEVHRDDRRSLMDQLIKAVLSVGPRLAPVDGAGVVVDVGSLEGHVFAVGLHGELLEVGRQPLEVLLIGHDADAGAPEEVAVPQRE